MNYAHHPSDPEFSDTPTFYKMGEYTSGYEYRTDVRSAVDWLGNRFYVDDEVMYCIGAGRGQMMALGRVRAIRAREVEEGGWDRTVNPTKWVVRGSHWEVEVQVLTERTSGARDNSKRTKPAWVNPMNITSVKGLV